MRFWLLVVIICSLSISGCASLQPLKSPEVSLVSIQGGKSQGLSAGFVLRLKVTNPNNIDLTIDGMHFVLDISDRKVLSGVSNNIPTLLAYSETIVDVNARVGLFEIIKLAKHFAKNTDKNINYHLTTTIDPDGFIAFDIEQQGLLTKDFLSGFKLAR